MVPRAVTPEKELASSSLAASRASFVMACRALAPSDATAYFERKLAKRAEANAEALAEAQRHYDDLLDAYDDLETASKRREDAIRDAVEREWRSKLESALEASRKQQAATIAALTRQRDNDRQKHQRDIQELQRAHDIKSAKQGVAYAKLKRKFDELKRTLATVARSPV